MWEYITVATVFIIYITDKQGYHANVLRKCVTVQKTGHVPHRVKQGWESNNAGSEKQYKSRKAQWWNLTGFLWKILLLKDIWGTEMLPKMFYNGGICVAGERWQLKNCCGVNLKDRWCQNNNDLLNIFTKKHKWTAFQKTYTSNILIWFRSGQYRPFHRQQKQGYFPIIYTSVQDINAKLDTWRQQKQGLKESRVIGCIVCH